MSTFLRLVPLGGGYGYVSLVRNHFNFDYIQIVFVLGRSLPKGNTDKRTIPDIPVFRQLSQKHNNRVGALCSKNFK